MKFYVRIALSVMLLLIGSMASAFADDICGQAEKAYPQLGRTGTGVNAYRPLPLFVPLRSQTGAPGTLNVSIAVDHVSSGPKGGPGQVYIGNYLVTDLPVFKLAGGASGPATLVDPETGNTITLPNQCLDGASFGYGGSLWSLIQADTLDVMFQSRLDYAGKGSVPNPVNGAMPCRSSNLHTHGLLVSPYHPKVAGTGPYGDYVLDATQPRHSLDYRIGIDDCDTHLGDVPHKGHGLTDLPLHYVTNIPGHPGVSSLTTGNHPSGLFWYHAHPHGFSQFQLHGGTTGVITIGALTDYACPTGDGTPGNCTITNTNIRVMGLKDSGIQPGATGGWTTIHDYESDTCTPTGGLRQGECQATDATYPGGKWIVTINGVEYPTAKIGAGQNEIWRIVNSSGSFTYRLTIISKKGNTALPFQLLAKDGVAVRQVGAKAEMRTEMLMTPATRVEIYIPAPSAGGTYILRTLPTETAENGNRSGNVWPQMDLGEFTWAAEAEAEIQARAQVPAPAFPVVTAAPETPIPSGNTDTRLPQRCRYDVGDTRVIYFVHRFVKVVNGGGAGGKSALLPSVNEVFGLIAGVRHSDGTMDFYPDNDRKPMHSVEEVWDDGLHGGDVAFPALNHNDYNTVCTVRGNVEHWELQNWTGEDHNFHLHQSKFTIDPTGNFFFPPPVAGESEYLRATDELIRGFVEKHDVTFNDTVPVPRGTSICAQDPNTRGCWGNPATACSGRPGAADCPYPGIMSVLIDFTRAEQVGTFVYHCHILEHEDGGMMAVIHVLCPPGDTSCAAQQIQEGEICTPSKLAANEQKAAIEQKTAN